MLYISIHWLLSSFGKNCPWRGWFEKVCNSVVNLKGNYDMSRIIQTSPKFCLFRFYSLNTPDVEESIHARSSFPVFLDIVSRNRTHILRKHFKLLYEHWITKAVKAFASNRTSERVRAALQQLSEKADSCERHTWKLDQERCVSTNPFNGASAGLLRRYMW